MKLPILLAPLPLLAACAAMPPGPPVPPMAQSVAGTSWHVAAINARATPPVGDFSMRFEAVHLGARFGCNSIGGDYVQRGYVIDTSGVLSTQMACPDMTYESQGVAILNEDMRATWTAPGRLRLDNSRGSIDLVRR
jgi:heat shock protein HslJ